MPRLSHSEQRARQCIEMLVGSTLLPEELARRILDAIAEAIPADGQLLGGLDHRTLLFNRALALTGSMMDHWPFFLRHLYLREPIAAFTHASLMRSGISALVIHERPETSWGMPGTLLKPLSATTYTRAYQAVSAPAGGVLRAFFTAAGQWRAALELVRYAPDRPFRRGELAFVRMMSPLIGNLLHAALLREHAIARHEDGSYRSGVAIVRADGEIAYQTPMAAQWLDLLADGDTRGAHGLPTAVWAAIADLKRADVGSSVQEVHVPTTMGIVRVEASPGEEEGTVALVLRPKRADSAPDVPLQWPLTAQERRVTALALMGWSVGKIATTLFISDDTVASHLRHTHEKLGVHSRADLIARYFADVYAPTLAAAAASDHRGP